MFNDPKSDYPELYGYDISLEPSEILYPTDSSVFSNLNSLLIRPHELTFGWTPLQVTGLLGKPILRIDNSESIPGHVVYLYKRRIRQFAACTQVHFLDQRLFLVIEEIKKNFQPGQYIAGAVLKSLGYELLDLRTAPHELIQFIDSDGNILVVEEEILVKVRMQAKG